MSSIKPTLDLTSNYACALKGKICSQLERVADRTLDYSAASSLSFPHSSRRLNLCWNLKSNFILFDFEKHQVGDCLFSHNVLSVKTYLIALVILYLHLQSMRRHSTRVPLISIANNNTISPWALKQLYSLVFSIVGDWTFAECHKSGGVRLSARDGGAFVALLIDNSFRCHRCYTIKVHSCTFMIIV